MIRDDPALERASIGARFQPYLLPGEEIIWAGKPMPGRRLTRWDFFWLSLALITAGIAVLVGVTQTLDGSGVLIILLCTVPVLGYFFLGRVLYEPYARNHCYYAVTNARVLALSLALSPLVGDVCSVANLDSLPDFAIECGADGIGTIGFGSRTVMVNFDLVMAFREIPDARRVYEMIDRLRRQ